MVPRSRVCYIFVAPFNDFTGANEQYDDPLLSHLGSDPVGLDALLARTGLETSLLQAQLMALEIPRCGSTCPAGYSSAMHRG